MYEPLRRYDYSIVTVGTVRLILLGLNVAGWAAIIAILSWSFGS